MHCFNFLLNIKYYLGDHVRKDKTGTAVACVGEKANSYSNLMGKSEGKGKRGRPIRTRGENTKINLNTFTAIVDFSRSNFSIARAPLFQLKSAT